MTLDSKLLKNINNLFKKAIDQYMYIQDTIQVFQIWHNLCELLKCMLATTNEPTASNNYRLIHGLFHIALVISPRP